MLFNMKIWVCGLINLLYGIQETLNGNLADQTLAGATISSKQQGKPGCALRVTGMNGKR